MSREIWGHRVTNRTGHELRVDGMVLRPEWPEIRLQLRRHRTTRIQNVPIHVQVPPKYQEKEDVSAMVVKTGCDIVIVNMLTLRFLLPVAAKYAAAISSRHGGATRSPQGYIIENNHIVVRAEHKLAPGFMKHLMEEDDYDDGTRTG